MGTFLPPLLYHQHVLLYAKCPFHGCQYQGLLHQLEKWIFSWQEISEGEEEGARSELKEVEVEELMVWIYSEVVEVDMKVY